MCKLETVELSEKQSAYLSEKQSAYLLETFELSEKQSAYLKEKLFTDSTLTMRYRVLIGRVISLGWYSSNDRYHLNLLRDNHTNPTQPYMIRDISPIKMNYKRNDDAGNTEI